MNILSIIASIPAPTGDEFKVFLECVCFALAIFVMIQKALGKGGVPQPMKTKEEAPLVEWPTYEKDRDELRREIKRIERDQVILGREVSAVESTLVANGLRLVQMDGKMDRLMENFGLKTRQQ